MLDKIRIVMVNTTHSGNIGAAARAMKNMGLSRLVLVDPIASIDEDAIQRSSRAEDILHNAVIVPTLEEAIADCGLVIGTSARSRHIPWPLMSPRQSAAKAAEMICSPTNPNASTANMLAPSTLNVPATLTLEIPTIWRRLRAPHG